MEPVIDHLSFVKVAICKKLSAVSVFFAFTEHADISISFFIKKSAKAFKFSKPPLSFHNLQGFLRNFLRLEVLNHDESSVAMLELYDVRTLFFEKNLTFVEISSSGFLLLDKN